MTATETKTAPERAGMHIVASDTPQVVAEKFADIKDDLNRANFIMIASDIFAAFEARAYASGQAEMRERAAKVAEDYDGPGTDTESLAQLGDASRTKWDIADIIRSLDPSPIETADERTREIVAPRPGPFHWKDGIMFKVEPRGDGAGGFTPSVVISQWPGPGVPVDRQIPGKELVIPVAEWNSIVRFITDAIERDFLSAGQEGR